jgi:ATP-dependent protease ClpP protease subunit
MSDKEKKINVDKESMRLDYSFDRGINFADRCIQLTGAIEEEGFDFIDAALCELERHSKKAITIKIHSGGGSVYEALAIVGRLRASKCHIITEGYGCIMSAASLILAAGNKRRMSRYAMFMHHEASYGIEGRHSEIQDEIQQMEREERLWSRWIAEMSAKDAQFWYNHGKRKNFYMTADECEATGVIDEVF